MVLKGDSLILGFFYIFNFFLVMYFFYCCKYEGKKGIY